MDYEMTIEQFEIWLQQHPQSWSNKSSPVSEEDCGVWPLKSVPAGYKDFLKRIGPICVFDYCLLSPAEMRERTTFVHSLSYPQEGINFSHLVAFCSQGYDNCYFCFDGERVVDFDPLEPGSVETAAANSFSHFLARLVNLTGL